MNNTNLATAGAIIVLIIVAVGAYIYLSQPEPITDRMGNAATDITNGDFSRAADDMDNQTRGEQMGDDIQHSLTPDNMNVSGTNAQ